MSERLYTLEEANALLPHLAPALVELRERFEEAAEIRVLVTRAAAGNGWSAKREQWSRTLARVAELLERLQEWEVELKDIASGLIDFPTMIEGRDAYLCWRLGEPEVAHWHFKEDGFRGRRPL
ncbi:MAG: DUF2203 domain-containing protein [Actinomycetota bacterium]